MSGAATQRRRVAFLALLAASEHGVGRDHLVGLLWPENSEERARHALSQLLYSVRREFGEDVVQGDAVTLRLNHAVLASDVADFRAALNAGDRGRAADLYAGPFMPGFFVSGCPGFERWTEETRAELAERARDAVQSLAVDAERARDLPAAVDWWRRLARLAPLDSRVALSLMKALAAAGDRAGALEYARVHEAIVRGELEAPLDPAIARYVAELKASPTAPQAPKGIDDAMPSAQPHQPPAPPVATAREPAVAAPPVGMPPGRSERWRWAAAFILGLGTLAAAGALASYRATPDEAPKWVLIADALNPTGDSAFSRTLPVALAAALNQSQELYPVPPDRVREALKRMRRLDADSVLDERLAREIAQREGIAAVAVPAAERSGNGFELSVKLIDPATGGVTSLIVVRAADRASVIASLDQLSRKLRRELGESRLQVARNSTYLPLVTTGSLDALRKFAEGDRAFGKSKYGEARSLWSDAIRLDPGFASAHAALGMLAYFTNAPDSGATHFKEALEHEEGLPERERVRIRAAAQSWRGNRDSSVALLTPYLSAHPEDLDLWKTLGYDYLRAGRDAEAERVLSRIVALDSLSQSTLINLATIQKRVGRYAESLVTYRRAFAIDPDAEVANNNVNLEFGATYVRNNQSDSARAVFTRLLQMGDPFRRGRALRSLAFLDMHAGRFASAAEQIVEAADIMKAQRSGVSEVRNRILAAQTLDQLGKRADARRQLDAALREQFAAPRQVLLLLYAGRLVARWGDVPVAQRVLKLMESAAQADVRAEQAAIDVLRGEILVAQGRAADALPHLRSAFEQDGQPYNRESLALGLAAAGALDSAIVEYGALEEDEAFGVEAQLGAETASLQIGRLEERRGRPDAAMAAYQRLIDRWKDGDSTLIPLAEARQRLAVLRGAASSHHTQPEEPAERAAPAATSLKPR